MQQKEMHWSGIEKNNQEIAVFAGDIRTPLGYIAGDLRPDLLQYHTSYDWLMPVVEKIRSMNERFVLVQNSGSVILRANDGKQTRDFDVQIHETGLEAVWQAVVQFINWHNSNHPSK